MMDALFYIGLFGVTIIVLGVLAGKYLNYLSYKHVERDIKDWVISYRKRCTDNNRFIVTVETLQNSFREYDTSQIEYAWASLVKERIIEQDPVDQEWCIRKGVNL